MLTALVTEYPSSPRRMVGPCNVCPWREPQRFHLQQSQLPLGEETSKTDRSHFSSRLLLKTDKSASSKRAESLNLGGVSRRRCCDFRFVTPLLSSHEYRRQKEPGRMSEPKSDHHGPWQAPSRFFHAISRPSATAVALFRSV